MGHARWDTLARQQHQGPSRNDSGLSVLTGFDLNMKLIYHFIFGACLFFYIRLVKAVYMTEKKANKVFHTWEHFLNQTTSY